MASRYRFVQIVHCERLPHGRVACLLKAQQTVCQRPIHGGQQSSHVGLELQGGLPALVNVRSQRANLMGSVGHSCQAEGRRSRAKQTSHGTHRQRHPPTVGCVPKVEPT